MDKIVNMMKLVIVLIEDKWFVDYSGVDWKGILIGLVGYVFGDFDMCGGLMFE